MYEISMTVLSCMDQQTWTIKWSDVDGHARPWDGNTLSGSAPSCKDGCHGNTPAS